MTTDDSAVVAVTIARATGDRLVWPVAAHYVSGMETVHGRITATRRCMLMSTLALPIALSVRSAMAASVDLGDTLRRTIADLPLLRGDAIQPDDLSGRVTVVNFFASWCPPCRPEMAHLNQLLAEIGPGRLTMVGINLFENFGGRTGDAALVRFLDQTRPAFPILRGDDGVSAAFGGVDRIPTVFVFDRSGRMATRFVHRRGASKTHLDLDELREAVAPLLSS